MAVDINYPQSRGYKLEKVVQVREFRDFHYSSLTANIKVRGQLLSNDETK